MPTYLERYLQGDHEQVWAQLQSMGEQVRDEPVYSDAVAVARETMLRVRQNIELLIPRLEALGYYLRFALRRGGFPGMGMPSDDIPPIRDEIRAQLVAGMLPF